MSRVPHLAARLQGFGTTVFAEMSALAVATGSVNLGQGFPDYPGPPEVLDVARAAIGTAADQYPPGPGTPELRTAVAEHVRRFRGLDRDPGTEVLVTAGATEALSATLLALLETGDEVVLFEPMYDCYAAGIAMAGGVARPVPLHPPAPSSATGPTGPWTFDPDDLRTAITARTKVLLLNTPHNPTGAVIDRATLEKLGTICAEHDLWIVCDEVYAELIFEGSFTSPLEIESLRERVVVVSSVSKSHAATGFRSGWAIGPAEFCAALLPISETMLFGNQPFIADMTEAALRGDFDTSARMREAFGRRARMLCARLNAVPGLSVQMPRGGMFLMLDVAGTGLNGEAFAWRLLDEQGVAVMPGSAFGGNGDGLVRVALTVPDAELEEAARRVDALCADLSVRSVPSTAMR